MQVRKMTVRGLFGKLNHEIDFPTTTQDSPDAGLVLLHGPNGVGKTTLLHMLDGALKLDFGLFRTTPFSEFVLEFNDGRELKAYPPGPNQQDLRVTFDNLTAKLHPRNVGAYAPPKGNPSKENRAAVQKFRRFFFKELDGMDSRLLTVNRLEAALEEFGGGRTFREVWTDQGVIRHIVDDEEGLRQRDGASAMKRSIKDFIANAQVDQAEFFSHTQSAISRLLRTLNDAGGEVEKKSRPSQVKRIDVLREMSQRQSEFGIKSAESELGEVKSIITRKDLRADDPARLLAHAYLDVLEADIQGRELIHHRLRTYTDILNQMLLGKTIAVSSRIGFEIFSDGTELPYARLSSGEKHLLHIFEAALTVRRRGSLIIIDEPEVSLHIAWQSRLIESMKAIAANASPQFIIATHSPDILAGFEDFSVALEGGILDGPSR